MQKQRDQIFFIIAKDTPDKINLFIIRYVRSA